MGIGSRITQALFAPVARAFSAASAANASWLAASQRNPWEGDKPSYNPATLTAVHASVTKLTAGLVGADWQVAQKLISGGSRRITSGFAASVISSTPMETWQRLLGDWLLQGNAFAEIKADRLVYIAHGRAMLVRKDQTDEHWLKVTPLYSDNAEVRHLAPSDFLHLKMLPSNSELLGQSPLDRLSPGLSLAVTVISSASQMMANAVNPGGLLVAPNGMKPEARDRLRQDFAKTFSASSGNAGKLAVLDVDARIERLPTVETMLADSMVKLAQFGVAEVARAYSVPLSLLAQTSDTNRSTAAEEARQFSVFGVQPLAAQLADALSQFLLSDLERASGERVVLDLRDALLGYGQERAAYASTLVNSGLASKNELRDLLGLPDVDGGDSLAVPTNTVPLDTWLAGPPQPAVSAPNPPPDPTRTYTPPSPPEAPSSATEADFRIALAEARLRASVAPAAFTAHCQKLVQGYMQ